MSRLPVVQFTAAFVLGTGAAFLWSPAAPAAPAALSLLVASAGLVFVPVPTVLPVALIGLGYQWIAGGPAPCQPPAGPAAFTVQLHDAPGPAARTTATVRHDARCHGAPLRISLPEGKLASGSHAVLVGVANRFGVIRVDHARPLGHDRPLRFRIRDAIRERVAGLYGARAPLVEALVVGRRADLPRELRDRFTNAGAAHLLAISGLHIGILAGWVFLACSRLFRRRTAWLFSAGLVWLYVAVLGFPASAVRAALFLSVAALAGWRERHPPRAVVVCLAVAALLVADPHTLTSVGAWLSVAAVCGTAFGIRWSEHASRDVGPGWARPVITTLASSAGATIFTAPITALVFGHVAPVGLLTNLLAMPLAAVAVPGVFLSLVLGPWIAGAAGLSLAAMEWTVRWASAIPGGHITMDAGITAGLAWSGVSTALVWVGWRFPTAAVSRRRALLVAGVPAVCWWVGFPWVAGPGSAGQLEVHVISVGQGDAIAVRTPADRWVVVDGGPGGAGFDAGERIVIPHLRRHGVDLVEAVMVSHPDADHVGGAAALVREFSPRLVLEPGVPVGSAVYRDFLDATSEIDARWHAGRTGDSLVVDAVRFVVLHPTPTWVARETSVNERSVVLRVSYGEFDLLLTGDIGFPAESVLIDQGLSSVDVLKVGHHGSRFSTGFDFLDAIAPRAAVISVGRNNRYGHPAPEALARLQGRRIPVFRTDDGGTVTITTDGRYFHVMQGNPPSFLEKMLCVVRTSLRSSSSSSTRNACIRKPRVTLPTSSTT